jgi:hypothetical protein
MGQNLWIARFNISEILKFLDMNSLKSKIAFSLVLSITIGINACQEAHAATKPLTKCHIEIHDPHISSSMLRNQGVLAVKIDADSVCNRPMSDLVLTVEIYKLGTIGYLFEHKVAVGREIVHGFIPADEKIFNIKTNAPCKNKNLTEYYGIAYATAVIDGKPVKTLHVMTERNKKLRCGT